MTQASETQSKKPKSSWLFGGVFVALVIGIVVFSLRQGGDGTTLTVRHETVERSALQSRVRAQGRVRADTQFTVTSEISGRVTAIHVKEGDKIEKGAMLFSLDAEQYQANVDTLSVARKTAKSVLARAELVLEETQRALTRDARLKEKGLVSTEVFVASQNRQKLAAADIEQARANVERTALELRRARSTFGKTVVKSPIAGTVVDLSLRVGDTVGSFSPVGGGADGLGGLGGLGGESAPSNDVVVADLDTLIAEMRIDEIDVARVKPGQRATVSAQGDSKTEVDATVRDVGLLGRGAREAVYFDATLSLPAGAPLLPGMSVDAEIVVAEREGAVVIPVAAVLDDEGGAAQVFIAEGTIRPSAMVRTVTLGPSDGDRVVVETGLDGGETLITGPYRSLAELKAGDAVELEAKADGDDAPDRAKGGDKAARK